MAKVYVTRCLVKKDGKSYKKGSVIKDLTNEEIKQGLAEHWLETVGNDDDGNDKKPAEKKPVEKKPGRLSEEKKSDKSGESKQDDPLEKMTADELIAEAAGLGFQFDNSMSEEVLRKLIREARQ
jgi:hypothetical protein